MPTVQKFDRSMIERYLEETGWPYNKDDDGDFWVSFAPDEDTPFSISVLFAAQGDSNCIYTVLGQANRPILRSEWGRALLMCNNWNKELCWGKAYLSIDNPDTDTTGKIFIDERISLENGIHQELFREISGSTIGAIWEFWKRAHKEHGF
jgi:Putative bacterial sensory transduction regulator